ncbi:hypothetical protein [Flavobacterium lipolyticum]|uniref:Peptidase S74 domain-containing protein n=1 Tax=Flavobacterium lipolyticum TaxID=2893754 RepID=A0ABS8M407_9FLAO|nr:hypothetical protein [Flavobacterium sp. F-126]MCC9019555.1 hypothetical protein [Flavobacterium sp. F-126]
MNKKVLPLFVFVLGGYIGNAQVGIGTATPNNSSQLEIVSTDKGILIPQVSLKSSKDTSTIISGNVNSLLVFNTATISDITPGYYYWFDNKWLRLSSEFQRSLIWDPANNAFSYIDNDGKSQIVNLAQLIKTNETVTTLVRVSDGKYTYTNEKGALVTIDIANDISGTATTIFKNPEVIKELETVVKDKETVTTLVNKGAGEYTYKNEKGTDVNISVLGDIKTNIKDLLLNADVKAAISAVASKTEGTVGYDPVKNILVYADAAGVSQTVDLSGIVKTNETVTTLVRVSDGKYTYTNEKGTLVSIDIANDISGTATTIFKNPEVIKELETVVKDKETVTTLVRVSDGKYTYTNEKGALVTIDIANDISGTATTIFKNPEVIKELETVVKDKETVTTLVRVSDGKYTYTNEKGALVTIDIANDISGTATTIFKNPEIIKELETVVKDKETVTTLVRVSDGKYTYTNEKGALVTIDIANDISGTATTIFKNPEVIKELETVVKDKETVTTLVNKGAGEYTYKNEKGTDVNISVLGDIKTNIKDLLLNADVKEAISTVASKTEGTVGYDPVKNILVYADAAGVSQTVDLSGTVKTNETVTTLVKVSDGKYTYTNEKGALVTIDIANDISGTATTIFKNPEVIKELETVVKDKETVTTLVNKGAGEYTYKNEKGTDVNISVLGDIKTNIKDLLLNADVKAAISAVASKTEGTVGYDPVKNILVYADAAGVSQTVDLSGIVKTNETVTTLVKVSDGKYTYTNEKGALVTIDIANDISGTATTIFKNPEVIKELETVVKDKETVTTLVNKGAGEYTYKNEKGTDVNISVLGDIKTNIKDLLLNADVKAAISAVASKTEGTVGYDPVKNILVYADAAGVSQTVDLSGIVKTNETVTTLVKVSDGKYTYTNEKGALVTIDIANDISGTATTIFKNPEVIKELETVVKDKETVTTLVNKGAGEYTYKNEKGTDVNISVLGDIKTNIKDLLLNADVKAAISAVASKTEGTVGYDPVKNILVYADAAGVSQTVDLSGIVKTNETVTTLVKVSDGKYTYTNEKGALVTIDIANDISGTATTIFKNLEVIKELETIVKDKETVTTLVRVSDGKYTYTNEKGALVTIDIANDISGIATTIFKNPEVIKELETVVKDKETVTTLVNKGAGEYTYKNEKGTDVNISVLGDIKTNIKDLLLNADVKEAISAVASKTEGTVGYDPVKNILVYADAAGVNQTVDLSGIVKTNETVTSLTKNLNGTITYKNEKGIEVTSDLAIESNVFSSNGTNLTSTINGKPAVIDLQPIIKLGSTNALVNSGNIMTSTVNGISQSANVVQNVSLELLDNNLTIGANEVKRTIDVTQLKVEPWNLLGGTSKATSNSDQIYTLGSWVGIGVDAKTSFGDEALRVNGKIRTNTSVYADYVFEDYFQGFSNLKADYEFKSLKDVEEFIIKNRHLPGVTPISKLEKVENGYAIDPTELGVQNLEKIEELYLYTIEQQKQIDLREKEIDGLKMDVEEMKMKLLRLEKIVFEK